MLWLTISHFDVMHKGWRIWGDVTYS